MAIAMFALCLLAAITGVAIAFYYTPSTTNAYSSIEYINNQVTNGWLIRSLHNIAGNGLIADNSYLLSAVALGLSSIHLVGTFIHSLEPVELPSDPSTIDPPSF